MARALGASLLLLTTSFTGCVSTQLELAENDPASPRAATAPLPKVAQALDPAFDPAAGNPAPPAATGAHDAHQGHGSAHDHAEHEHPPAAPAAPSGSAPKPPLDKPKEKAPASPEVWTCPMHPEIRKSEPGNCPICGMKLVPAKPEGKKP
jgi:hypothetical protein